MTLLVLAAAAFAVSVILTAVVRSLALRCGVIDEPDGVRKLQNVPVPLWGGVAVFVTFASLSAIAWSSLTVDLPNAGMLAAMVMIPATLIFVIGLVDDSLELSGRVKLCLQIVAVAPLLFTVHWFDNVGLLGNQFSLGYLAWPLALLWLVGCINAVNLLDGMDGNASLVSIVAALAIAGIGMLHGHTHIAGLAVILAGAILGFLVFNRPPASIYLGDCGSTVIGLLLGVLCMEAAFVSGHVRLAVPVVVMAVPILDTGLAMLRRRLTGRSFTCADRGHIHHRLLERGMPKGHALALMGAVSVTMGLAGFAAAYFNSEPLAWLTVVCVVVAMTHLRFFGNHEWSLVKMTAASQFALMASRLWRSVYADSAERPGASESDFDHAWESLTREVACWSSRRLEFSVYDGQRSSVMRRWDAPHVSGAEPYHWNVSLAFSGVGRQRYQISVWGDDSVTAEPWYLPKLAAMLRAFGRHWSSRPGEMAVPYGRYEPAGVERREAA